MSHQTRKSFKEHDKRDKPRHSDNAGDSGKKGGAGGKGTWGSAMDDVKYMDTDDHAVDKQDPNYDPADQKEAGYTFKNVFVPAIEASDKFVKSLKDLASFKTEVRKAVNEHLISHDVEEFVRVIRELDFQILHQELPAIMIKAVLDRKDEDRQRTSVLLQELHKQNLLTPNQVAQGFTKLFHNLDELAIDFPNAKKNLSDFVGHAIGAGYLDGEAAAKMEKAALYLSDHQAFVDSKKKIRDMVTEYFSSEELSELKTALADLNPAVHFEFTKQLVTTALDRSNREREMASVCLASCTGSEFAAESVGQGFLIMLGRLEDTSLDVPNVLELMSCFLARAVADEVLSPSFLVRVDLSEQDMGYQVISQAQVLLQQPSASARLQSVWGKVSDDE